MKEIKPAFENEGFSKERPLKVLKLCASLTPIMNKLHRTNYSERFWIMVLGHYVTTCLNRMNYLEQETYDYVIPFQEINSWKPLVRRDVIKAEILYLLRSFKAKGSVKKLKQALKFNNNICFGPRGKELAALGRGVYCDSIMPLPYKRNNRKRRELNQIAFKERDIFFRNLLLQVPRLYVEYFMSLVTRIPTIEDFKDKIFHVEHNGGVFMNMLLAFYSNFGSKVFQYQLGGYIGETQASVDPLKYATIDKHLTYGWKVHEKDEPFYAIRLETFKRQIKRYPTIIKYDVVIVYNQISSEKTKRFYLTVSHDFFSLIDYNKYRNIILRPRGVTRKVSNAKKLAFLKVPSNIQIDRGMCEIAELVAQSKIVVQWTHPSTNFLECVYIDHPIVTILKNPRPTDIIVPYYDFFLSVGVMHENAESLISHLNSIDIDVWWAKIVNMQLYKEFKNTFARESNLA